MYQVVLPAKAASLVESLKVRCWGLYCSLCTQLLLVISSDDTTWASISTLWYPVIYKIWDDWWNKQTVVFMQNWTLHQWMWMVSNLLKVNDGKTVALVLASQNNQAKHNITVIKIGKNRNIGAVFDLEMSMVIHVKYICHIAYYHLRNIALIRSCFTQKAAVHLMYSLVILTIDYVNCFLHGIPDCLINKLQRVQNAAAQLVVRCHRWDHFTPVLKKLHWLPVKQHIHYAILLLIFCAQHGQASVYITDLLHE